MKGIKRIIELFQVKSKETALPETNHVVADQSQHMQEEIVLGCDLDQRILTESIGKETESNRETEEENFDIPESPHQEIEEISLPVNDSDQVSAEENLSDEPLEDQSGDETETNVEIEPISPLENKPFVKLVEECIDLMNEFESYTERLESEEGKMMAQMIVRRLQESLERSGLERIDDEKEPFTILKHKPEPMMPVAEGKTLKGIIAPGLAIENRVFRKAKVLI